MRSQKKLMTPTWTRNAEFFWPIWVRKEALMFAIFNYFTGNVINSFVSHQYLVQ